MTIMRRRWMIPVLAACVCLGAYWGTSGLLRLHEVFASAPPAASPASPASSATDASAGANANADAPQSPGHSMIDAVYDRLVVVLIDALRADMVLGPVALDPQARRPHAWPSPTNEDEGGDFAPPDGETPAPPSGTTTLHRHMRFTRGLLAAGRALPYVAHASIPTVTMPRLKALLTGKPPAFIDVLKNFNSAALDGDDNLIALFRRHGRRLVFYGDDTWLKLFPTAFARHDGTSGFFTRDTVEVDTNVTRHLGDELDPTRASPQSRDWDVLVLHYLGLDHVGHLRGPRSPLMVDKLEEMDGVVRRVVESVDAQDRQRLEADPDAKPTLVLLCSDHGMTEGGNHGGATVEEASALMAFIPGQPKPPTTIATPTPMARDELRRYQVDLVPTIAALFGLPVPGLSTGMVLEDALRTAPNTTGQTMVAALHQNYRQLRQLASVKIPPASFESLERSFSATVNDRLSELVGTDSDNDTINNAISGLREACARLQEIVVRSDGSEYDERMIGAGILLLLGSACASLWHLCGTTRKGQVHSRSWASPVLVIGSILQIASLSSSSSIENEHATAFFMSSTLFLAILLEGLATAMANPSQTDKYRLAQKRIVLASVLLVCNRLLRERNQVINFGRLNGITADTSLKGNEFANDDSLSIWSTGPLFVSVPRSAGFVVILFAGLAKSKLQQAASTKTRYFSVSLYMIGMLVSWYCYQLGLDEHTVFLTGFDVDNAARVVYGVVLALLLVSSFEYYKRENGCSPQLAVWLMVTLLQRSENISTLAVLSIEVVLTHELLTTSLFSPSEESLTIVWLSFTAFFALGNSHLVTTVDISQSYLGLEAYSQGVVGFMTFINVFSGPLACLTGCWRYRSESCEVSSSPRADVALMVIAYQAIRMAVYTIIVYLMRFHLFVWSVFAPKMLYEFVFTIVFSFCALIWS